MPLGPTGDGYYQTRSHDLITDEYIDISPIKAKQNSVLIIDGSFLFKPDLREALDFKIYVEADFDVALERGSVRDKNELGGYENAKYIFSKRYLPACKMYLDQCEPIKHADLIVINNDLENPQIR
ncbi:hypothetical protein VBD025_14735 [Virgibacillus flavescens]|uniref:hypothetical protein n=1 Tax=Virgibacillus flavescens TaxID=1611422 RepID=UPI003D341EA5